MQPLKSFVTNQLLQQEYLFNVIRFAGLLFPPATMFSWTVLLVIVPKKKAFAAYSKSTAGKRTNRVYFETLKSRSPTRSAGRSVK
jgi:hypothetical protein